MNECNFSFCDLYRAAFGKNPDKEYWKKFTNLPQEEINTLVKSWAKIAKWNTQNKIGTDGYNYTAFWEDAVS